MIITLLFRNRNFDHPVHFLIRNKEFKGSKLKKIEEMKILKKEDFEKKIKILKKKNFFDHCDENTTTST